MAKHGKPKVKQMVLADIPPNQPRNALRRTPFPTLMKEFSKIIILISYFIIAK